MGEANGEIQTRRGEACGREYERVKHARAEDEGREEERAQDCRPEHGERCN